MKKTFLIYFCLITIQIVYGKPLTAQENVQAKKMIVGKWKFYTSELSDKNKQTVSQESADALLAELNENSSYKEYKADGTWEGKFKTKYTDHIIQGTWKLDTDGKTLIFTTYSGLETSVYILELTDHKLVEKKSDGGINTYIK